VKERRADSCQCIDYRAAFSSYRRSNLRCNHSASHWECYRFPASLYYPICTMMLRFSIVAATIVVMAVQAYAKIVEELSHEFKQTLHWGGMEYSLCLQFSPNTDHVFVAEKNGRIRLYDNIDVGAVGNDVQLSIRDLNMCSGRLCVYSGFIQTDLYSSRSGDAWNGYPSEIPRGSLHLCHVQCKSRPSHEQNHVRELLRFFAVNAERFPQLGSS
jgi:hypothetical protein